MTNDERIAELQAQLENTRSLLQKSDDRVVRLHERIDALEAQSADADAERLTTARCNDGSAKRTPPWLRAAIEDGGLWCGNCESAWRILRADDSGSLRIEDCYGCDDEAFDIYGCLESAPDAGAENETP